MPNVLVEALAHASQEYPKESCGLVIILRGREKYLPCQNVADKPEKSFLISPQNYADAEDIGEIIKIVHSHPQLSPSPSQMDMVGIESSGLPWLIINPKTHKHTETSPTGYKAPLIGRKYSYGVMDCYTLIYDYYKELGISLPKGDFRGFVNDPTLDLITPHFKSAGFRIVSDLKKHDLIVMNSNSKHPNHIGVYTGESSILHHCLGRLSSKDAYGNTGYWDKCTKWYLRHIDLV